VVNDIWNLRRSQPGALPGGSWSMRGGLPIISKAHLRCKNMETSSMGHYRPGGALFWTQNTGNGVPDRFPVRPRLHTARMHVTTRMQDSCVCDLANVLPGACSDNFKRKIQQPALCSGHKDPGIRL